MTRVNIGTAEKLPARVRLVATGTAGHGSVPRLDNALIHLGAAVEKVGRWETPMRLNDTTRAYFEKLAGDQPAGARRDLQGAARSESRGRRAEVSCANTRPGEYSMLRTSVVPDDAEGGRGRERDPVGSGSHARHPRAARMRTSTSSTRRWRR